MARINTVLFALSTIFFVTSYTESKYTYPFQDPNLGWHDRVEDLVGRLTLEEIVSQTMALYGKETPGIPRLGINPYIWITECLRGQASTNGTAFPQAIGLGATFRYKNNVAK